jgi:hypothetical protein
VDVVLLMQDCGIYSTGPARRSAIDPHLDSDLEFEYDDLEFAYDHTSAIGFRV